VYDALDVCQADAGAFEFVPTVKSLKDPEEFIVIGHIETYAVVSDIIHVVISIGIARTSILATSLYFVNFTALERRLINTCLMGDRSQGRYINSNPQRKRSAAEDETLFY
jgi:hypothetical protein